MPTSAAEALALFDGLLENDLGDGKAFRSADDVDPLLFRTAAGAVLPLWITHHPQARLRVLQHRA